MSITNQKLQQFSFLEPMYRDDYFPNALVDKGKRILVQLCEAIEHHQPANDEALFALTHAATEGFNMLAEAFAEQGSEIETVAREAIAADFDVIVNAYGFDVAIEEVIAPREW
jgi:hypothetical protein